MMFLVPGLNPRQGGVQVSALDALAGFSGRHVDCIVYGADPLDACPRQGRVLVQQSKFGLASRMLLRRWPADIALCWHLSMLKLLPLTRGFTGKVVLFVHGIEAWRSQTAAMVRKLQRVDLFLSNSDHTWQEFLKFVPQLHKKPHITVPLGFGELAPVAGPRRDPPSVLMIARMAKAEDYKGHRELISAWPEVLNAVPNARLDIVGEGDLRPELERLVKENDLSPHIVFHGRVDESTKNQLLRECTAFAMPSRGEGFGIVYLEAMRYGRPCLVSNCDAGREVVNPPEAGLEVNVSDQAAVLNALTQLLSDGEQWQSWSVAARSRYESRFTVAAYQQRLVKAIDSVLVETPAMNMGQLS